MPFRLDLPRKIRGLGWKVKIQDKERLEPPHVTVWHIDRVWRISLRSGEFMVPPGGSWKEIDAGVRALIEANWQALREAWDAMYPHNPIQSPEDKDDA
jgi:hypothetical protein